VAKRPGIGDHAAIAEAWLAATLGSYPEHTARFMTRDGDPFRNPVGHALKESLPAIVDGLFGDTEVSELEPHLDDIVRIRAVQDFTPSQAVSFLFDLKKILRRSPGGSVSEQDLQRLDARIDELALLGFDLYMRCREKTYEIRAQAAHRRVSMLIRAHGLPEEPGVLEASSETSPGNENHKRGEGP